MSPKVRRGLHTSEEGAPAPWYGVPGADATGIFGWQQFDEREYAPDLKWSGGETGSTAVYERMQTDAQVKGLLLATTMPARRKRWEVDPNGARDVVTQHVARSWNLPIRGAELDHHAEPGGFNHDRHLAHALAAIAFGHYYFERVYRIGADGLAHLDRLATRPPRTIWNFLTDPKGNLLGIVQRVGNQPGADPVNGMGVATIDANSLLSYVWEPADDGDWAGRALALDTPVPTPDGWRTIDDLGEGDKVFDERGRIAYVTETAEWDDRPCYEIEFSDGTTIIADENHQWLTTTARERYSCREASLRTTAEIAETQIYKAGKVANHAIPIAEPLDFPAQHLLVDPWFLGLWLGDGTANDGSITGHVDDSEETAALIRAAGYPAKIVPNGKKGGLGSKIATAGGGHEGLAAQLRILGVKNNKHIPEGYLCGSIHQRVALLQGLMDSDGYVGPRGQCTFDNTNLNLIDGVAKLVRSLGMHASVGMRHPAKGDRRRDRWSVYFTPPPGLVPFRLTRKVTRASKIATARRWHYVRKVCAVARRRTKCIEVSSPSHLFLAGEGAVPTHNSMLRPLYRNWLLKDRLIRVDATKHERNSMGIPWFETDPNATPQQIAELAQMAQEIRTSSRGGGAGAGKLTIKGVEGSLPDVVGSIRYHDQQMTSAFLADFITLGKGEVGSFALGQALIDFHAQMIGAICDWYAEATQPQIEDEVLINWGENERCPRLAWTSVESKELELKDLAEAVDKGLIEVDADFRSYIGQRFKIPGQDREAIEAHEEEQAANAPPAPVPTPDSPAGADGTPAAAPATTTAPQPARSALAAAMLEHLKAPTSWPDLARAIGKDAKNGTARRARDQLLAEGVILKRSSDGRLAPMAGLQLPDRELRRNPKPFEVEAAVDFAQMEATYDSVRSALVAAVKGAQPAQVAELAAKVEAADGSAAELARLTVEPVDIGLLTTHLLEAAEAGVAAARTEHLSQRVGLAAPSAAEPREPSRAKLEHHARERAEVAAATLAAGLGVSASKKAAAVSTLDPAEAARTVTEHLNSLTDAALDEQLGAAAHHAYNAGRFEYMAMNAPKTVYASEILDKNTCSSCASVDGTEWASVAEAEGYYPGFGGFVECEGGDRCRGTLISLY